MKLSFRWFGEDDDAIKLEQIRQIPGVKQVVSTLYHVPVGKEWPLDEILKLKKK